MPSAHQHLSRSDRSSAIQALTSTRDRTPPQPDIRAPDERPPSILDPIHAHPAQRRESGRSAEIACDEAEREEEERDAQREGQHHHPGQAELSKTGSISAERERKSRWVALTPARSEAERISALADRFDDSGDDSASNDACEAWDANDEDAIGRARARWWEEAKKPVAAASDTWLGVLAVVGAKREGGRVRARA